MRLFSISAFIFHLNSVRAVNKQCQQQLLRNNKKLSFQENKSTMAPPTAEPLIRRDGLKINYDPYAPEMVEKYGAPGNTDSEGFDPYSDSVGPGIYGGRVKRDQHGEIVIGKQYQGHNSKPGPVYAGGGYTPMSKALRFGPKAIAPLLEKYPELVNEVSTGGASPLHMCGMGADNQISTAYLIERGGDMEATDTYGYKPLHRMASNNLAIGARALLEAGANLNAKTGRGETAISIAKEAGAMTVLKVLKEFDSSKH